jgi:SAM-dependent methyltransferase
MKSTVVVTSGPSTEKSRMELGRAKRLLNAGSGPAAGSMHPAFDPSVWTEVRIDIDPRTAPDLVGTISDMHGIVEDGSFDAIWCSHCIEHLHDHEVLQALREFRRILSDAGFAIVSCPNLDAVAKLVVSEDIESVAYLSQAGPVRLLDMIFGHSPSIEVGRVHMAHRTGFTVDRLGRLAAKAGFEARVLEGENYDLWAALMMPKSDAAVVGSLFEDTNIAALFSERSPSLQAVQEATRRKRVRILRT